MVRATGDRVSLDEYRWLDGPIGHTRLIGKSFFVDFAKRQGLDIVETGPRGLVQDFAPLAHGYCREDKVSHSVRDFYEQTSEYELDASSEWRGGFQVFGTALVHLFSRRLKQLNVPLSSLDSSRGITSEVLQLCDPVSGLAVQTAWVRHLLATGNVLHAGSYWPCHIPGHGGRCIKVVFPLPNGNAIVIMSPEAHADGSFSVTSAGQRFGDPGFYFVVYNGTANPWARYIRSLRETIKVYEAEPGAVRADHNLWIWGQQFLRLHYRMRRVGKSAALPGINSCSNQQSDC